MDHSGDDVFTIVRRPTKSVKSLTKDRHLLMSVRPPHPITVIQHCADVISENIFTRAVE